MCAIDILTWENHSQSVVSRRLSLSSWVFEHVPPLLLVRNRTTHVVHTLTLNK